MYSKFNKNFLCVYISIHTYTHIYIHIHTYIHIHIHIYIHMHIHTRIYTNIHTYIHIYIQTYTHTHHKCTYSHIYKHIKNWTHPIKVFIFVIIVVGFKSTFTSHLTCISMSEWSLFPNGDRTETSNTRSSLLHNARSIRDGLSQFLPLVGLFTYCCKKQSLIVSRNIKFGSLVLVVVVQCVQSIFG